MASPHDPKNSRTGFYSVLGLASNASPCAIRNAYRKLAMKWHPDKCYTEDSRDAKIKFQEIHEAYTVLSDSRKKALYDHGLYDPNDSEEEIEGLSCFMHELSGMMSEVEAKEKKEGKPKANSLEDIQQLFLDIFGTSSQIPAASKQNIIYPSVTKHINNKRSRHGEGSSVLLSESESCIRTSKSSPLNGHVFFSDCFDINSKAGKKKEKITN